MSIPNQFPRRDYRAVPAAAVPTGRAAEDSTAGPAGGVASSGSWP
jgi:hypothetical protein